MSMIDEFTDLRGVTQERAEKAAEWLVWSAAELGAARAERDYCEKLMKVSEKREFLNSTSKTVAEREADAVSSAVYAARLDDWASASEKYEVLKATADAAAILIDTWRSINSAQKGARA